MLSFEFDTKGFVTEDFAPSEALDYSRDTVVFAPSEALDCEDFVVIIYQKFGK